MKKTLADIDFGCACTGCPGMRAAVEVIQKLEARILGAHESSGCAVARLEKKVDSVLAKIDDEADKP